MIPEFQSLTYEVRDRIALLTLNRPEVLNACNSTMHRELQAAIELAETQTDIGALILTGAGRAFCSGSDLREIGQYRGVSARRYIKLDFETKNRVAACSKPVVAALHGHVAGGGFELALACDIRFVADDVLFSLPEIILGTIPGAGGLQRLPGIVGLGIAKEWVLTGRRIGAEEAYRTGLANHVCKREDLMEQTLAFTRDLAQRAPLALALAKIALDPSPPADDGLISGYHMLTAQACHDDPAYHRQVKNYEKE